MLTQPKHLFASLLICASLYATTNATCEPLKIGIPIPLTGSNAAPGQDIQRGFELGKEMLGLKDVELFFEDDACDGTKSVTAVKKLLEKDRVNIISGIYCNNALLPAAPALNRANIPVLTVGATSGDQLGIGKKIFRIFPADQQALEPLMPEMSKYGTRLCVMTETDTFSALIERTIERRWPSHGSNFTVTTESINSGSRDMRTPLLRLLNRGCDSMLLNVCGDDGFITSYRQLRAINAHIPIFALYFPSSSAVIKALPDGLKGVTYADLPSSGELTTPLGQEFVKRYKERYGEFLIGQPIALLAFEALRLITESRAKGIPLEQFLKIGPIKGGAIREYYFDNDGALQGVEFVVVRSAETGSRPREPISQDARL